MDARTKLSKGIIAAAIVLFLAASAFAAGNPPGAGIRPMAGTPGDAATAQGAPPDKAALEQLTSLFIVTVAVILGTIVVMVALALVLRRKALAARRQTQRGEKELEDLWWKMQGPAAKAFDKEKKEGS